MLISHSLYCIIWVNCWAHHWRTSFGWRQGTHQRQRGSWTGWLHSSPVHLWSQSVAPCRYCTPADHGSCASWLLVSYTGERQQVCQKNLNKPTNWLCVRACDSWYSADWPICHMELRGPDFIYWQDHFIVFVNGCVPRQIKIIPYLWFKIKMWMWLMYSFFLSMHQICWSLQVRLADD